MCIDGILPIDELATQTTNCVAFCMRNLRMLDVLCMRLCFMMNSVTYFLMMHCLYVGFLRMVYGLVVKLLFMIYCMGYSIMMFDLDVTFFRIVYSFRFFYPLMCMFFVLRIFNPFSRLIDIISINPRIYSHFTLRIHIVAAAINPMPAFAISFTGSFVHIICNITNFLPSGNHPAIFIKSVIFSINNFPVILCIAAVGMAIPFAVSAGDPFVRRFFFARNPDTGCIDIIVVNPSIGCHRAVTLEIIPFSICFQPLVLVSCAVIMQIIFLSAGSIPAVLISTAPAAEEIELSTISKGFIRFHAAVTVQIIEIIFPCLPSGCDPSVFCQFPYAIHGDPLGIRYICTAVEGIASSVNLSGSVLISTAPAAQIADFSAVVQPPLVASHGSVTVQIVFTSLPFLPASRNLSIFCQIPVAAFYDPL